MFFFLPVGFSYSIKSYLIYHTDVLQYCVIYLITTCHNKNTNNQIKFNIYRVGQKSVPIRWVLYHRRVLYLRVVALQMAFCTYLFEDSVTKI